MNTAIALLYASGLRGLILALIAWLLYQVLRPRLSAAMRHRALLCALAALGFTPVLIGLCEGWKVMPAMATRQAPAAAAPLVLSQNPAQDPVEAPKMNSAASAVAKSDMATSKAIPTLTPPPVEVKTDPPPTGPVRSIALEDLEPVLLWLWAGGACVGALVLAWELRRLSVWWSASCPWQGVASTERARQCADKAGLQRVPALHLAADDSGPFVFGFIFPKVLLPAGFESWPQERQRAVLMHEFVHARRGDPLSHFLTACVCVLHWFNPLAWLLLRSALLEAECACDDAVLRTGMRPEIYAEHLLAVASGGRSVSALVPSMSCPSSLRQRVHAVLDVRARRGAMRWSAAAIIAAVMAVIGLPVMLAQTVPPEKAQPAPAVAPAKAPAPAKTDVPKVAVTVKFRDAAGQPVSMAQLRLFRVDKPEPVTPFTPEVSVTADAAGLWQGEIAPGEYVALASKENLVAGGSDNPSYLEILKKDKQREFEFKLSAGGALHVSATDAVTGRPLANARVVVDSGHCGITNDQGELTLQGVPMGDRQLVVVSPPLADTSVNFNSAGQAESKVAVKLGPGFEIRGRVTDPNGKPIQGAAVKDHFSGPYLIVWLHKSVTDADGNYQLGWYSRTRPIWSMEVTHKDYAEQNRSEIPPPVEGPTARCDIGMDAGLQIGGTVKDAEGKGIKGATVRYGDSWSLVGLRWARSDAEGKFTITKIGRTELRPIVAEAEGFAPAWVQATPVIDPAEHPLSFVLQKGLVVKGQIVDRKGNPVPKVSISPRMRISGGLNYVGRNVQSDQEGRFELRNLAATEMAYDVWGLTVSPIRSAPLDPTQPLRITVDKPGAIVGKIIDAATKKPITFANVRLSGTQGKRKADEPSASYSAHLSRRGQDCRSEDGTFIIDDLITRARHDLWVSAPGYALKHVERLAAQPADDPAWPLEIAMERGHTVIGMLRDARTQQAVAGARVFCVAKPQWPAGRVYSLHLADLRDYGSYNDVEIVKSDEKGRVEIHLPLSTSAYSIVVLADGYAPVLLTKQSATNGELKISDLQPAAKVRGTLAGLPDLDPARDRVSIMTQSFDFQQIQVQPDGTFEVGGLPLGTANVVCTDKDDGSVGIRQTVILKPGETSHVDFLQTPTATIHVEVTLNGKPEPGAQIAVKDLTSDAYYRNKNTDKNGKLTLSRLPKAKAEILCIIEGRGESRELDLSQPGEPPTLKFEMHWDKAGK